MVTSHFCRQLRDLQAKVQDETFVAQTNVFLSFQRQTQAQGNELEKARKMAEGLQRECDSLKHNMIGLYQQVRLHQYIFLASHRLNQDPRGSQRVTLKLFHHWRTALLQVEADHDVSPLELANQPSTSAFDERRGD